MRQKSGQSDSSSEQLVKDSRRATRKQYSAEEKIRILLDGYAASIRSRSFAGARDWREPLLQLVEGIPGSWQSDGWRAIRRVRRPAARSRIFDGRRRH